MSVPPTGRRVECPACGADAFAIIPSDSSVVDGAEAATGKVWVNCPDCGERYLVYYRR